MFSRNSLHGIQSLLDPVAPCRIHVDRFAVAPQCLSGFRYLDIRTIECFKQGFERRIEFGNLLDRANSLGTRLFALEASLSNRGIECGAHAFRNFAAVLESLAFTVQCVEFAGFEGE